MKQYIFGFSQDRAVELKLDTNDLVLLSWMYKHSKSEGIESIDEGGEKYFWYENEDTMSNLPILKITTRQGLKKRLTNLEFLGILKHFQQTLLGGGSKSFYHFTKIFYSMLDTAPTFSQGFPSQPEFPPYTINLQGVPPLKGGPPIGCKSKEKVNLESKYSNPLLLGKNSESDDDLVLKIFNKWNEMAPTIGLSKALKLSKHRIKVIKTNLIDSFWKNNWEAAMNKIPNIPFLLGTVNGKYSDKNWKIDFDRFIKPDKENGKPDTVSSILEGKYENNYSFGKTNNNFAQPVNDYDIDADQQPELTLLVANSYAKIVLGEKEYPKIDRHFVSFAKTAAMVANMYKNGYVPATEEVFIRRLVRCAQHKSKEFGGSIVYPGSLCSDSLWTIDLPQYCQDRLPGTVFPSKLN